MNIYTKCGKYLQWDIIQVPRVVKFKDKKQNGHFQSWGVEEGENGEVLFSYVHFTTIQNIGK